MDNNKNIASKKKSFTFSDSLLCPYHLNPIVYTCKLEECINDTGLCMQCIVDQHSPTYVHYTHGLELLEVFLSNHQVKGTSIFDKDTLTNDLIISNIQGDSNSNTEPKSLHQHQNEMNESIYLIKEIIAYGSGVLSHEMGYLVEELKKPFKTYKSHLIAKKLLKQNAFCSMMESTQNDERLRYFKKIREVIHDTNLNKLKDFNCNYDIKKINIALSTFSQELKDFIKYKIKAIKESLFEANDAIEFGMISNLNSPNPYCKWQSQQSQQSQQAQLSQQSQIVCSSGRPTLVIGEYEQSQSPQQPELCSRLLGQNLKKDHLLSPKYKPKRKTTMMIGLEFERGVGIGIGLGGPGEIGQDEEENRMQENIRAELQGSTLLQTQGNDRVETQGDDRLRTQWLAQLQAQRPSQTQAKEPSQSQTQGPFQAPTQGPSQAPTMQGKTRLQAQSLVQMHTQSTNRLNISTQVSSPTLQAIDFDNKPANTSSSLPLTFRLIPQPLESPPLMSSLGSSSPQALVKPSESAILLEQAPFERASLEQASFEQTLLDKTLSSQTLLEQSLLEPSLPQSKDNLLKKKLQGRKSTQRRVKRTILDQSLEKKPNEEVISSSAQSSHMVDSLPINDSGSGEGFLEDQDNNTAIIKDVVVKKQHIAGNEGGDGANGGGGVSNGRGGDASGSSGGGASSSKGGEIDTPVDDIKMMTYNNGKEFITNGDAIAYCKQLKWGFNNKKNKSFICLCTVDISKNLKFIYLGATNDICTLVRDPNDTKNYVYQDDILNIPITNLTNIIKITTDEGPKLLTLHLTQINLWDIDINTRKLKHLIKKDLKYHIECHTVLFDHYLVIGYYRSSNQISKIRVFDIQHNKLDLIKECQTSFHQLIKAIHVFKPDLEQFNDNVNNDTSSSGDSRKIREEPINSLTNGKKARSPSIFTPSPQALSQGLTLSQSLLLPKPSFISQSLLPSLISTPPPPSLTVSTKTKEGLSAQAHAENGNKSIRLISINSKGILFIHEVSLSPTTPSSLSKSSKKYKLEVMKLVKSDQILNIHEEQKEQKPKQKHHEKHQKDHHHKHNQEQHQYQQEDQSCMMIFSSSRCLDHAFLTYGAELYCFHLEKLNKIWRINTSQSFPSLSLSDSNQSKNNLGNLEDLERRDGGTCVQDVIVLDAALQSMLVVVKQNQLAFYNMKLNPSNIPEFDFHQLIKDINISYDKHGPKFQIIHNPDTEKTLIYLLLLSKNKNLIWYQLEIKTKVKNNCGNGDNGNGNGGTNGTNGENKEINDVTEENLGFNGDNKPK